MCVAPTLAMNWRSAVANNVTTHHSDNARTGWNSNETVLTPAAVNPWNFGFLFQQLLDDIVYAQPLYMEGLWINGMAHNVVFVATENGTVYAFDADHSDNQQPLWQPVRLIGGANEVRSDWNGVITSTPVIDPSTNTMYVVGYFRDNNISYVDSVTSNHMTGAYFFRLHAIDVITGNKNASSTPLYNPFLQLQPDSGAVPNTVAVEVPGAGVPQDPTNAASTRVAAALRMAALSLRHSQTALGAYYRKMAQRLGGDIAVFATARKLATLIYRLLRWGQPYVDEGAKAYEARYRQQRIGRLAATAKQLGYQLAPINA
jgi:hypothetical protein